MTTLSCFDIDWSICVSKTCLKNCRKSLVGIGRHTNTHKSSIHQGTHWIYVLKIPLFFNIAKPHVRASHARHSSYSQRRRPRERTPKCATRVAIGQVACSSLAANRRQLLVPDQVLVHPIHVNRLLVTGVITFSEMIHVERERKSEIESERERKRESKREWELYKPFNPSWSLIKSMSEPKPS